MATDDIRDLTEALIRFRDERDWAQYHNPKDLAMALAIEAGELQEHFLWLKEDAVRTLSPEKVSAVAEEVADVAAYLLLLCDAMNIDLATAVRRKIVSNAQKYPVDKVRGSSRKYTEY
ncbi:MAG: nucleotide pyrophosphohydrolase [Verrucomicrobia bacterium]|nr:nucleotide pyrophosphohydrolase [Verrucomicrobiota bacterium]